MKRRHRNLDGLVPHPRFGTQVRARGNGVDRQTILESYWGYRGETFYPESAIPADPERQNYSAVPRGYYVDLLKRCRDCRRSFLFFAEEQKHWYEELGFWIDADCVRCPECRRELRSLRRHQRRYEELVGREELDDGELAELVEKALALWENGLLRDEQKLRRLKNRAGERIPAHSATRALVEALDSSRPG